MRGRCCIYDLGTWFHLDRLCSATQFPVHTTFSQERFIYLTGNVWPITSWNSMPYTCLYIKEASRRAQDNWTFLLGLRPRPVWDWAQGLYGPGISVPYNWDWAQGLYGPGISVPYSFDRKLFVKIVFHVFHVFQCLVTSENISKKKIIFV